MLVLLQRQRDRLRRWTQRIGSALQAFFFSIPNLTQQGVLYLSFVFVVFILSVTQENKILFQVSVICFVIFVCSFVFSYINLRGIKSSRVVPRYVFAKDFFLIKVTLENTKKNVETYWLTLEDDFYKREHNSLLSCVSVKPQSTLEKEFMTTIPRRGIYHRFSYRLLSTFPFGFFIKEEHLTENMEVTVFPAPMPEAKINFLLTQQTSLQGDFSIASTDYLGELRGVRSFQPGDPVKTIHWSASLRMNQLFVKEFESTSSDKILIIAHSVNVTSKRFRSKRSFEIMLRFLTGYFIYKSHDFSECSYCFSFDGYQTHQVDHEKEALYETLGRLACAKEYKETSLEALGKNLLDRVQSSHYSNILVIGNTARESWEPFVKDICKTAVCVDTLSPILGD